MFVRFIFVAAVIPVLFAQKSQQPFSESFQPGCCFNPSFPRPQHVSQATVPTRRLREALHCATNNSFVGGTRSLAANLGDPTSFHVAYYYGRYMPEQGNSALTVAVYSADGKHGVLFDLVWQQRNYSVENLPELLRVPRQWRVGGVDGGLWTYTRLWYLAQEIGSRPKISIPVLAIEHIKPSRCWVFVEDQTNWKPGGGN